MSESPDVDAVVVGGGIAGLTAAYRLGQSGRHVLLIDAADTPGGAMRTVRRDGFLLEQGPFNVIVRSEAFADLLNDFADDLGVIRADSAVGRKRFVLVGGRLRLVPTSPGGLLRTDLLSGRGKRRLLRGLMSSRPVGDADETVADVVRRRFGAEVDERLTSAVTVGVYAAESDELSLRACLPTAAGFDAVTRSPIVAAVWRRLRRPAATPAGTAARGLISFRDGLGALPTLLAGRLDTRPDTTVTAVQRSADGFGIAVRDATGDRTLHARSLVVATGLAAARRLVGHLLPTFDDWRDVRSASLVVVNLGFRADDVTHPLDGYGFLVPRCDRDFPLLGVLFADSVFPHHAPPGHRLLRAFLGGTRRPGVIDADDATVVRTSVDALRPLLGLRGQPVLTDVCRWPASVPVYAPGHVARVATLRRDVAGVPGLHLIGNYLDGVSVNDAVRRGAGLATRRSGSQHPQVE